MSFHSSTRFLVTCSAIFVLSFCLGSDANAQRGFRIGNILQAGGGQGFRLGGPNVGMHFGGGQGASIGTQNFGMRFGNGQGARFGGASYGMQFGGQQGTQIGQFATQPSGTPGTYYYGAGQDGRSRPLIKQPIPQPNQLQLNQPRSSVEPTLRGMVPSVAGQNARVNPPLARPVTGSEVAVPQPGPGLAAPMSVTNGARTVIAPSAEVPTEAATAPKPDLKPVPPTGTSVLNKTEDDGSSIDKK